MPQNTTSPTLLIIDDDGQVRQFLVDLLSGDYECLEAASAEEALTLLQNRTFDLVLSDIGMSGISGLELVPRIHERAPDTVVVMISGQQTIDFAIEAMRAGAFDYITKPIDLRQVQAAVTRALNHHELIAEKRRYENNLEQMVKDRTAQIEHLAYHDRLTDLANRSLFEVTCETALAASANTISGAVLLVSLDRFKKIVNTLGHAFGDSLLNAAAQRMRTAIPRTALLARFDADEFGILITDMADTAQASRIASTIAKAMQLPFSLDGHEVFVTTSTGISLFPANGTDVPTILRNARAALDRAKQKGGNNHQFYFPEMNAQALNALGMETNLRRAVEDNELVVYYQPIWNLGSGRTVAFEALVRWQHPTLGLLDAVDFIGMAEDTGLILEIGTLTMRTACAQLSEWHRQGRGPFRIAINVSARQVLEPDFTDQLIRLLANTRIDAQSLELEITETSIMENSEGAIRVLSDIRRLGTRVSIDDFGTGYSSLSYLKCLPIDTVKLDRSFVSGATTDPKDAGLVMALVTMAHNLNLRVIAEGIETEEQHQFLRLLRCDEGQGFLLGRAAPADALDWDKLNSARGEMVVSGATEKQAFGVAIN